VVGIKAYRICRVFAWRHVLPFRDLHNFLLMVAILSQDRHGGRQLSSPASHDSPYRIQKHIGDNTVPQRRVVVIPRYCALAPLSLRHRQECRQRIHHAHRQ
jgi:hypothetical protein